MSMTDPNSDMLTRIRNGQKARKGGCFDAGVEGEGSCRQAVLKDEGYITDSVRTAKVPPRIAGPLS